MHARIDSILYRGPELAYDRRGEGVERSFDSLSFVNPTFRRLLSLSRLVGERTTPFRILLLNNRLSLSQTFRSCSPRLLLSLSRDSFDAEKKTVILRKCKSNVDSKGFFRLWKF